MRSPLYKQGSRFSRSGRWSIKGEGDSGRGKGIMGEARSEGDANSKGRLRGCSGRGGPQRNVKSSKEGGN